MAVEIQIIIAHQTRKKIIQPKLSFLCIQLEISQVARQCQNYVGKRAQSLLHFANKSKEKVFHIRGGIRSGLGIHILIWKLIWGNTLRSGLLFFALLVPSLFMHEDDFTFHGNGNTFTVVRWLICLVTDCWTRNSKSGGDLNELCLWKKKYLFDYLERRQLATGRPWNPTATYGAPALEKIGRGGLR